MLTSLDAVPGPVPPRSPVLLIEWARSWQHTHNVSEDVPGWVDLDDPALRAPDDPQYLRHSAPAVQAYLNAIRAHLQPEPGPTRDDPAELRRRMARHRRAETTNDSRTEPDRDRER